MAREDILRTILFTPGARGWGLEALFWGVPGCGKTDVLEAVCARYRLPCEVLSPGERGEGAFGVTPVPVGKDGSMRMAYPAPDWVDKFEDADGAGVVFVDEMSCAPPALQPPLLGLLQAHRVGSHYLGRRVRVLGAANPPAMAAGGWDLAAAVANRVAHLDWDPPTAGEWGEWLTAEGSGGRISPDDTFDASEEETRVVNAWPGPYAKAKGLVRAFVYARPELLHKMPADGDPQASRAWPSHRTWAKAVRAIAGAEVHGLSEGDCQLLVAAFVGAGPALELAAFKAANDLPDPELVLDGKVLWAHDPARLDRTMAVLGSCAAFVAPTTCPRRDERGAVLWEIIGTTLADAADIAVPVATSLVHARLTSLRAAVPVLSKLRPVLDAAGIRAR